MKDRTVGVVLLTLVGWALFERPVDQFFFIICVYCFGFVVAELGVWMGVMERK